MTSTPTPANPTADPRIERLRLMLMKEPTTTYPGTPDTFSALFVKMLDALSEPSTKA